MAMSRTGMKNQTAKPPMAKKGKKAPMMPMMPMGKGMKKGGKVC